ncbi:NtaA/DmoA family FMN-dependent monooxygenase [Cupriavidus plantarum]|uniref:FMN-dependent oxidoreductase (Nitrilotriacetate monooxygenase family) n=1 Tax=Cupriavidus plantarum TaxID=942865 RepID=A0A316EPF3_9BURK|nr:NtaA/DmoA family FMN-dependent monooxygenase [Cupriavidus plantarum]PWK34321.1 FMN-dependent oxidoreductase (nitrilotriacetate monooxygenase family) [Cupriavidus plantarum]
MPDTRHRQLHLGLMFWATGTHSAGWRHPLARADGAFDIAFIQQICRDAEASCFDFIFLGDRLVADPALAKTNPGQMARLEPFIAASAIAAATERIGIVVTTNTTYSDPFTVARMLSSLDHISAGRASWNIVTGADPAAALNFSRAAHSDNEARYARAESFTRQVRALWDSWGPDALTDDGGQLAMHKQQIRAGGAALPRSPQHHPIILHAGTSERSLDFGARHADVIFTGDARFDVARDFYREVKARAAAYGRNPDDLKVVPGLTVIAEPTTDAAVATYDALNRLLTLDPEGHAADGAGPADASAADFQYVGMGRGARRNLSLASDMLGVDVRGNAYDALVPPDIAARASERGRQILAYITRLTRRDLVADDPARRITYLDLIHASIAQSSAVVGNPEEVADYMQWWFEDGAADGFNIFMPFLPYAMDRFGALVVPELQRRGIYRRRYAGPRLRDHFHLQHLPATPSMVAA